MQGTYAFFQDPAHGWVSVPRNELDTLGIAGEISAYSYIDRRAEFVYLEEDTDATKWARAYKAHTGEEPALQYEYFQTCENRVRRMRPYAPGTGPGAMCPPIRRAV